ncbi:hypothetical protein JXA40_03180 [bacterium]|nr:hypothetical protein [candidate division CSSED10-310 bacterium]
MKISRLLSGTFLFFLGLYLLTSGGHFYVTDEGAMYFMADSIVDHGWFDVPVNLNTMGGRIGRNGAYYMPFGLLQPILSIPFLIIGRLWVPWGDAFSVPSLAVSWFNPVVTAGLIVLFIRFLIDLGVPAGRSVWLGFGVGLSTCFWVYSQTFFTEPLTALTFLMAAWSLQKFSRSGRLRHVFLAGIWASAMLLTRPLAGIALPPLFLFLVLLMADRPSPPRTLEQLKPAALFLMVISFGISLLLAYNYIRFGSILETGYDRLPSGQLRSFTLNPMTGLKILLFSPGKSIFLFNPLCLAALSGMVMGFRRKQDRPLAAFALVTPLVFLLVLSQWARVEGGVSWGPRLMLPAFPVMLLALALPARQYTLKGLCCLTVPLIIIGTSIQFSGVAVNFTRPIHRSYDDYFHPETGIYRFEFNPIPIQWKLVIEEFKQFNEIERYPEVVAEAHRNLLQNNPSDNLDFWWIQGWRDRLNTGFIMFNMLFQGTCVLAGLYLVLTYRGIGAL